MNKKYYKAGRGILYIFYPIQKKVVKLGFKPFNKRVRIKNLVHFYRRFSLLCSSDFEVSNPEAYLELSEVDEWKELELNSYL